MTLKVCFGIFNVGELYRGYVKAVISSANRSDRDRGCKNVADYRFAEYTPDRLIPKNKMERLGIDSCAWQICQVFDAMCGNKIRLQTAIYRLKMIDVLRFLHFILRVFFMIIMFYYPLALSMLKKMHFILERILSKYFVNENLNDRNINVFDLYHALLIKLRVKQINISYSLKKNKTTIKQLLKDIQPSYDYFLCNTNKRKIFFLARVPETWIR